MSSTKQHLLNDLKIDRNDTTNLSQPRKYAFRSWLIITLAVLAIVAWLRWDLFMPSATVNVAVAQNTKTAIANDVDQTVLDASGYITARRQATVSSKVTGKIVEVLIEEGMKVNKGQILARLDNANTKAQLALAQAQLSSSQAAIEEVKAQLKRAQLQLVRVTDLEQKQLASIADLDQAIADEAALVGRFNTLVSQVEVAKKNLAIQQQFEEDTTIRAPFSGIVVTKDAQPGEIISPVSAGGGFTRTGICTIVDMESLEIEVDVNENYINRVSPKQPATARLNAYPQWQIPATVIAIIPTADRQKATVKVRLALNAKDPRILPDMGVKVSFLQQQAIDSIKPASTKYSVSIPRDALIQQDDKQYVFVVTNNILERRLVDIAHIGPSTIRLHSGVRPDELVVVDAQPDLKHGDSVNINKQSKQ